MTTKRDRNLSYAEAVAAGLIPEFDSNDDIKWVTTAKHISNKNDTFLKSVKEHWESKGTFTPHSKDEFKSLEDKKAVRFDEGKTNWSLMPFEAIEEINKVLEFGVKKYAAWNFIQDGGMNHSRVINSMLRHIFAYMQGEDKDPESGLSHIAHVGCNVVFLLYYNKYPEMFKAKDDRHVR